MWREYGTISLPICHPSSNVRTLPKSFFPHYDVIDTCPLFSIPPPLCEEGVSPLRSADDCRSERVEVHSGTIQLRSRCTRALTNARLNECQSGTGSGGIILGSRFWIVGSAKLRRHEASMLPDRFEARKCSGGDKDRSSEPWLAHPSIFDAHACSRINTADEEQQFKARLLHDCRCQSL